MSALTRRRGGRDREPPLRRTSVLLLLVVGLGGTAALLASLSLLRHPDPDLPPLDVEAGNPRVEVECPGVQTREGVERDDPATFAALPPVEVSSGDLLDCPEYYDGRRVVYRGEVVGQELGRGEQRWIQVNDDAYAEAVGPLPAHRFYLGGNSGLGVRAPVAELSKIRWRGGPDSHGDRVEVQGTFRRFDPDTGELAIIAAERLGVLAEGRPLRQRSPADRRIVAYVLALIAVGLGIAERRRAWRG